MIRLYTAHPLAANSTVSIDNRQSHYLIHVMRSNVGDGVLLFNGQDGEWQASITMIKKAEVQLTVQHQTRPQMPEPALCLIFAIIKRSHGDFMVEKASELGVSKLIPITTQHSVISRPPSERYHSIATEAAEQCERLSVPEIAETQTLTALLASWDSTRPIILCAETGAAQPLATLLPTLPPPYTVLIGPEGGFSAEEFALLRSKPFIHVAHLGQRILRADTAALAALAIIQGLTGDWQCRGNG